MFFPATKNFEFFFRKMAVRLSSNFGFVPRNFGDMKAQVLQGNDAPLNIELKDATGTPINPDHLSGLLIILYYKITGQVLARFSKNVLAGFEPITVLNAAAGQIQLKVQREKTQDAQLGDVMIEIKMKASSDEWSNDDLEIGQNGIFAFEITSSRLKNVTSY